MLTLSSAVVCLVIPLPLLLLCPAVSRLKTSHTFHVG